MVVVVVDHWWWWWRWFEQPEGGEPWEAGTSVHRRETAKLVTFLFVLVTFCVLFFVRVPVGLGASPHSHRCECVLRATAGGAEGCIDIGDSLSSRWMRRCIMEFFKKFARCKRFKRCNRFRKHDIPKQIYGRLNGCVTALAESQQPHVSRLSHLSAKSSFSACDSATSAAAHMSKLRVP